jgi:PAS domain S-box-containing protein
MSTLTDWSVAEAARDGILVLDSESGLIVDTNPFLTEIIGFSRAELLGRPLEEIGLHGFCRGCDKLLEKVRRDGYGRCGSLPIRRRDGRRIFVELVGTSYRMDSRTMLQFNVGEVRELP